MDKLKNIDSIERLKTKLEEDNSIDSAIADDILEAIEIYEAIQEEFTSAIYKDEIESLETELIDDVYPIIQNYHLNFIEPLVETLLKKLQSKAINLPSKDLRFERAKELEKKQNYTCKFCNEKLTLRNANGEYFWSCYNFPKCWGKRLLTKEESDYIYKNSPIVLEDKHKNNIKESQKDNGKNIANEDRTTLTSLKDNSLQEYYEILDYLSQGIDPISGEILNNNHFIHNQKIFNTLCFSKKLVLKEISKNNRKPSRPENAGKPWSSSQDNELLEMYKKGTKIKDISIHYKRSVGAIRARLLQLNVLHEDSF